MNIEPHIAKLRNYIETCDYAGYDPYDALNSPFIKGLSCKSKWLRIAFIQFLKRCPINLRPVFGVKKGHNPKGIGLFIWAYSKLYAVEKDEKYIEKIEYLLGLLERLKSEGYSGNCWGYNFDWQSRAFFAPKYTPTIVNSSFIGHALLDTYKHTGIKHALEMVVSIKNFILNDLNIYDEDETQCFSYTPIDNTRIHNSNMLGASLLIRLYEILGEESLKDRALTALAYSMKYQRADGSWYYGSAEHHHWIDSFHTGFNLQSIHYFLQAGFSEYKAAFERGVSFYVDNFFLQDGTPKYYYNCIYPIDIHAPSQAIVLFSALTPKYNSLTKRLTKWMLQNMYNPNGYFYFQKRKCYINKISYMRWSQAWAFHALTSFALEENSKKCLIPV